MRLIKFNTKLSEVITQVMQLVKDIEELKAAESSFQLKGSEIVKETLKEKREILEEALEETGQAYQIILEKADAYDRLPAVTVCDGPDEYQSKKYRVEREG